MDLSVTSSMLSIAEYNANKYDFDYMYIKDKDISNTRWESI